MLKWVALTIVALAGAAKPKDAAVGKVVELLQGLKQRVMQEGMKEATTYEKFACFCKENIKDKQTAIQTGKDAKAKYATEITEDQARRGKLDGNINTLLGKMSKKEKAMAKWKRESKSALLEYEMNNDDLKNAIKGLDGAIKVMKVNKKNTPAFVQVPENLKETIKHAAVMADALGLASASDVMGLLQSQKPEPYGFHATDIISTLEKLQTDFKKQSNSLDMDEKKRRAGFKKAVQGGKGYIKNKDTNLGGKRVDKSKTSAEIAAESKDLTGISAQLLDDQQYLLELAQMCTAKAKTWDQRQKVRTDELTALTVAVGIVKSTVAKKVSARTVRLIQQRFSAPRAQLLVRDEDGMEAIEEDAEEVEDAPMGFLQRRHPHYRMKAIDRELQQELDHPEQMSDARKHEAAPVSESHEDAGKHTVMMLLKKQGAAMHSSILINLASELEVDHFAKVKKLLQELVEKLLTQAAGENTQKGWCDKSISDAEQKRGYAADKLKSLKAETAENKAKADTLKEELTELAQEIKGLNKAQKDANANRKDEKQENTETVKEATEGLDAVKEAITILDRFYKTAAKEQVKGMLIQGPDGDAPKTAFDSGDAYKGKQAEATGVIGMLEVIESDFVRTVKSAEAAEVQSHKDHLKFSTRTQSSLAAKTQATVEKKAQKDDTAQKLSDAKDNKKAQTALLVGHLKELRKLQPVCAPRSGSVKDRNTKRKEEVAALQKALCIFTGFEKYGENGGGAKC